MPRAVKDVDSELDTLVAEAERIFGDDLVIDDNQEVAAVTWDDAPVLAKPEPAAWRPGRDKMIKVRGGGDYLGVRYRLLWMRKDHPDWTTSVSPLTLDWDAGIAIVLGRVLDESGRLIAEDIKTETRKDFPDFVEKACTGALGRALAGAGYGTEGALELDEGVSTRTGDLRIADAPVNDKPITITPSSIPGIKQGGRSDKITSAQLQAISKRSKELDLGPVGLAERIGEVPVIEDISSTIDPAEQQRKLLDYLKTFSFDQAANLLQLLAA